MRHNLRRGPDKISPAAEACRAYRDPVTDFRALHRPGSPLLLPNAWDVASALALAAAGFAAVGTTSLGVAAAHGLPDGAGQGRDQTLSLVRALHRRLPIPLTVDVEGGFGGTPAEVADLAAELAGTGAAGVNIEDGRPGGTLAPPAEQAALIAAVKARVPTLFVNARTDTHWLGVSRPETLDRARRYLDAGADGVFVPAVSDEREIAALAASLQAPLNVLLLPGMTVPRLAGLGVARVSTGSLLFRAALAATVTTARSIAAGDPPPATIPTYAETNALASGHHGGMDSADGGGAGRVERWVVWRQDDNGNRFVVVRKESRAEAEEIAAAMEARGHKQLYWVAPG
jgi:2-methylisocitrate lyase-like PEP mutase family enzyme